MLYSYDTNKIFVFFVNEQCLSRSLGSDCRMKGGYLVQHLPPGLPLIDVLEILSQVLHSGRTVEVISAPALQQRRPLIQSRMIFLKGIVTWAFFFFLQKFPPLVQNLAGYDCEGMFFFSFSTYMVLWSVFCVSHPHSATRRSDLCQPQQLPSFSCNPKTN